MVSIYLWDFRKQFLYILPILNMRNAALTFIYFLGLLWGTLFLSEEYLEYSVLNSSDKTVEKVKLVMEHELDVELTIWGASTAEGNISPSVMRDSIPFSMMNMGIDGANIDQYFGLYEEYLSYTQRSKYVLLVFDIHGGITDRMQLYEIRKWVPYIDNNRIYRSFSDIDLETTAKARYVPFYSLLLYDKHTLNYWYNPFEANKAEYEFKEMGFFITHTGQTVEELYTSYNHIPFEVEIGERALTKLKKACTLAIEKDIKPIIMLSPCYTKGYQLIQNAGAVKDSIFAVKSNSPQIEVWDYSNSNLSQEASFFRDNTHLSPLGAQEFSELIAHRLKVSN